MYGLGTLMVDEKIVNEVLAHVDDCGWGSHGWYVGIATDARDRLFSEHKVNEHGGCWIYRKAGSEDAARETEKRLLSLRPFKGGPGGGYSPHFVYAYQITSSTVE